MTALQIGLLIIQALSTLGETAARYQSLYAKMQAEGRDDFTDFELEELRGLRQAAVDRLNEL